MSGADARKTLHFIGLAMIVVFALFPFYWMVTSSFKDQTDLLASPPMWLFKPTIWHYAEIWADQKLTAALLHSLIVATATTVIALLLGMPAAYALARFQFRGKGDLWFWFISNRMISPIVLALPVYLLARAAGMFDTYLVLILIYLTFNLPIVVWICTDQFRSIPTDLEEAARLEGAKQFDIFWRLYLPLGLPGIAVSAIFSPSSSLGTNSSTRSCSRGPMFRRRLLWQPATCRATRSRGARSWRQERSSCFRSPFSRFWYRGT